MCCYWSVDLDNPCGSDVYLEKGKSCNRYIELQVQSLVFNESFYEDSGIALDFLLVRVANKHAKICHKEKKI